MRSISDYLRQSLADVPGIEGISHALVGGQQIVTVGNITAAVGPFASDAEIERAIRSAIVNQDSGDEQPAPHATPLPAPVDVVAPPAVPVAAPVKPAPKAAPIPAAGGFTPGSLKSLLQGIKDRQQSVMGGAVEKAKALHAALDQVEKMSGSMEATTHGIMAELGQFSNHPDEELDQ